MSKFFRIITPNYNNRHWLAKCIGSVIDQTFQDFGMVFVDDCSTDGSMDEALALAKGHDNILPILNKSKRYNGGSRNVGLEYYVDAEYTLFLDSDDWFVDRDVLQGLHDFIVAKGKPECVRLPYKFEYDVVKSGQVPLVDNTPQMLVKSCFVACWTKCIRTDLVQPFPENTMMEDVIQHIKQCDVINDIAVYNKPVVLHNRNNTNSITREGNQDLTRGKWQSSMYRYMADLLDMEVRHDYCEEQRQARIEACLKNIKNGVYSQSIIK